MGLSAPWKEPDNTFTSTREDFFIFLINKVNVAVVFARRKIFTCSYVQMISDLFNILDSFNLSLIS